MSLRAEQSKFASDIRRLLTYAEAKGYEYTFGEFERPLEMQQLHVAAGRSKTMNSLHIRRLAADIFFFRNGELTWDIKELGDFWESLDPRNSWGGNWRTFKDAPHFERRA